MIKFETSSSGATLWPNLQHWNIRTKNSVSFFPQPQRGADSSEQKICVSYQYRPLNICAACAMTSIFTLKCEIIYHLYDDSSLLDLYDNKSCEIIRINHLIKKLSLDLFKNHI